MIQRPKLLLLALLLQAALAGQAGHQCKTLAYDLPPGTFELADCGNYTGDQRISVAFSRSGEVQVAYDPSLHTSLRPTPVTNATGLVTLPSGAPLVADQVLVTCDAGVQLISYDAPTQTFVAAPVLDITWHGATRLHCARQGGSNYVVGIHANGSTVLTAVQTGGAWVWNAPVDVGVPAVAVLVADWDHADGGANEFVTLTGNAALAFEWDGTPLPAVSLPPGAVAQACVVLDDVGVGARVACLYRLANGQYRMQVRHMGSADPIIQIDTSLIGIANNATMESPSLRAARMGSDGDLLIHQRTTSSLLVVRRSPAGAVSQAAFVPPPELVPDPAANICPPVWHDLDHDGQPDSVFLCNSPQAFVYVDALTDVPWVDDETAGFLASGDETEISPHQYRVQVDAHDLSIGLRPWFAADVRFIVTVWHQADPGGSIQWVSSSGPVETTYVYQPFPLESYYLLSHIPLPGNIVIGPPQGQASDGYWWPGQDHVWIDLQGIDAGGFQVMPTETVVFTMQTFSGEAPEDYMTHVAGPTDDVKKVWARPVLVGGMLPRTHSVPPQ